MSDMRSDWNARAREDAHYYVAFGGRDQDEAGFLATGREVVLGLEAELRRFPRGTNPRALRALEIGCGPGRLMKPMSVHFGEIHGVDVSDEMIALARHRLAAIPHAHLHVGSGAGLPQFADASFDFVYSYAVYQHIPSREVVLEYMRDTARVLKPGGLFRGQFNSLPPAANPNTWSGVSFTPADLREFTRQHGLQLLEIEGAETQYMWTTWRRPGSVAPDDGLNTAIRSVVNARSGDRVVPARGRHATMALWISGLPVWCDLNTLTALIDGRPGTVSYIGPPDAAGLQQVNVRMPEGARTGLLPVDLGICPRVQVRVIEPGPLVPRIMAVTDGINMIEEDRSSTGMLKVQLEEVESPQAITATVGGLPVSDLEYLLTDPLQPRYEVNFRLPHLGAGRYSLVMKIGRRALAPHEIEIISGPA